MIELRGGLVVPGTPGGAAVDGYQSSLIAYEENNVGIVGIDPEVLIIIATRGAAETGLPCAPPMAANRGPV